MPCRINPHVAPWPDSEHSMQTPTATSPSPFPLTPTFEPPRSRKGRPPERRAVRSNATADALILALSASAHRASLDAVLIADDDGMLVCTSSCRLDLTGVAAVAPIVARGKATARVRRGGSNRELSVQSEEIGGELLHIAGLGGDTDSRQRELRHVLEAARRILM